MGEADAAQVIEALVAAGFTASMERLGHGARGHRVWCVKVGKGGRDMGHILSYMEWCERRRHPGFGLVTPVETPDSPMAQARARIAARLAAQEATDAA